MSLSDRHVEAAPNPPQAPLRPAETVMRLDRMGAFFPTRLSFMRVLMRRLAAERARVDRTLWEIDGNGFGRAVYAVELGGHTYSLIAFSNDLRPEERTDRVIAEAWDATFVLFDGVPGQDDIERLARNAPKQEAGRFDETELVLSRANKSMRLFAHVVDRLAEGRQPDAQMIVEIGYLMRTTAVYGNGKFGIADRDRFCERSAMRGPFAAEMLAVWLIRGFTLDLVEHVARARSPETAVPLDGALKRHLGIGNSTGLGMAPFLVNHPVLLNNWMMARETALARVRAVETPDPGVVRRLGELVSRIAAHLDEWQVDDTVQMRRIETLRTEWRTLAPELRKEAWQGTKPFERALSKTRDRSLECQELMIALILEPNGELIDGLADCMDCTHEAQLDAAMPLATLREIVDDRCSWAFAFDFSDPAQDQRFWYVSEEKLEPRLGERYEEEGAELELPLDIARRIRALAHDLDGAKERTVAEFLMRSPTHRYITRRVQSLARFPYTEIRDNLIAGSCRPIDMLRCKLSFFGASKFDPRSDRWTRITLFGGAPIFADVAEGADCDDWWLPAFSRP